MVANQKSQEVVYNKLARTNQDKANDAMLAAISTYDGENKEMFEEWIDELDLACRVRGHDFRTEIIMKSIGAVCKVDLVLTNGNCSDNQLQAKLFRCSNHESGQRESEEHMTEGE